MDTVAVIKALKKIHTEAKDVFHELYQRMSNMYCISETRRKFERQKHRVNLKEHDSEPRYRVKIFVPFAERALSQMEERFTNHNKKALSLEFILPKLSGQEGVQEKL